MPESILACPLGPEADDHSGQGDESGETASTNVPPSETQDPGITCATPGAYPDPQYHDSSLSSSPPPSMTDLDSSSDAGARRFRHIFPQTVVRKLRLHMDSSPCTSKSQFFLRELGLMLAAGVLDCAVFVYVVVDPTKFGLDLVTRQISGRFNVEDAFNHAQLVDIASSYATIVDPSGRNEVNCF